MFGKSSHRLTQKIEQLWSFDDKVGAVLRGDCYRGRDTQSKAAVFVSVTRQALDDRQLKELVEHCKALNRVFKSGCSEFGVDSDGIGFAVIDVAGRKRIDFDKPEVEVARKRLLGALARVSQIHSAGLACGGLTPTDLLVDSHDNVTFQGYLAGYSTGDGGSVPLEAVRYLLPDLGARLDVDPVIRDLFSLAVMGLELFGVEFPAEPIGLSKLDDYLKGLNSQAPAWVDSILVPIVRQPGRGLYHSAEELLVTISLAEDQAKAAKEGGSASEKLSLEQLVALSRAGRPRAKKGMLERWARSPLGRTAALTAVGLLILNIGGVSLSKLQELVGAIRPKAGLASDESVTQSQGASISVTDGYKALVTGLEEADDPNEARETWSQILKRARESGSAGAAGVVEEELKRGKQYVRGDAGVLARLIDPQMPSAERDKILLDYAKINSDAALRVTLGFIAQDPTSKERYREVLLGASRSFRSSVPKPELANLSTAALVLALDDEGGAAKVIASNLDAEVAQEDLWWLLAHHARRRTAAVSAVAAAAINKDLAPWPRRYFLVELSELDLSSGAPFEALERGARGELTVQDVAAINSWYDPRSLRAIYGVMLSAGAEQRAAALKSLNSKPNRSAVVDSALDRVRLESGDVPEVFAAFIGALGLADILPQSAIEHAFSSARQEAAALEALNSIATTGSPKVVRAALKVFGGAINPSLLLPLLDSADRDVRREVIPWLRELPLASDRVEVRDKYALEQDPEVREAYERELLNAWNSR